MRYTAVGRLLLVGVLLVSYLPVVGCTSQEESDVGERESSNLRPLAVILGQYRNRHRGQMPPDEEAFREYLATDEGQQFLERFGMASADELLVSERDGQPIVILYEGPSAGGVIAYERQGKDGRRMVVDNLGVNELLTEEEFRERVPDA